jgi:hypothetical protein
MQQSRLPPRLALAVSPLLTPLPLQLTLLLRQLFALLAWAPVSFRPRLAMKRRWPVLLHQMPARTSLVAAASLLRRLQ